ncbi:MAG: NifB/NifX family molybdenum-iron cluster-binding protein [Bacteroidales bacterium]
MKIAVPVNSDNNVNSHFGSCDNFLVYELSESRELVGKTVIEAPRGCGCKSGIAPILAAEGVKVLLAGGIGGGAINVLNQNGIEVIRGCSGDADALLGSFAKGLIIDSGNTCNHDHHGHHHDNHDHTHGHSCSHN